MTLDQLLAAARNVKGARRNVERRSFLGVGYTLWQGQGGPWWFAELDNGQFAVTEDKDESVAMVEHRIQEAEVCLSL